MDKYVMTIGNHQVIVYAIDLYEAKEIAEEIGGTDVKFLAPLAFDEWCPEFSDTDVA